MPRRTPAPAILCSSLSPAVFRLLFCSLLAVLLALSSCTLAQEETVFYPSRGVQVPACVVLPEGEAPFPFVVMVHGHNGSRDEHRGFPAIAQALADCGVASIRMDLPGCGESAEPFTAHCLTAIKADVSAAAAYARETLGASAIGLFGYSMGGRAILELLAEGMQADAVALLAPAADTQDLIRTTFEDFSAMHKAAKETGFYPNTFGDGQVEELSLAWFEDLLRWDDPAASAAARYSGPALVIYAQDDATVSPAVCAHVADMLGARTADASGKGHGYGFFLKTDPIREKLAQDCAEFFAAHLR